MIIKPKFDNRNYEYGCLDNNIKYVLINDKFLDKSYVTVSVNTGHCNNPKDFGGLAHFLEHVLFLGSNKYPDVNYFFNKINEYGGYSNAHTELQITNYYFNVYDNALDEIIDIFSRFFIDPLFNSDYTNRELNAVNSEHLKNINSDIWAIYQLIYYLTDKTSNMNNFHTGSLDTLKKDNIRDVLIDFYNKYYISNNISVCIASSKSLIDLKKIVIDKFSQIPNKSFDQLIKYNEIIKPFYLENINKSYHVISISTLYNVNYIWEIPINTNLYLSKDFNILKFILLDNSEKSFYFYLKNIGYLSSIDIEIHDEGIFILTLYLTKLGLDNLNIVETIFFSTLLNIYKNNILEYAKYYQQLNQSNFDLISKQDINSLCSSISTNLHYYKPEYVYSGDYLIYNFKKNKEYISLFEKYININNFIKIILSKKYNTSNEYIKIYQYNSLYTNINNSTIIIDNNIQFNIFDTNNDYLNINSSLIPDLDKFNIPVLYDKKHWYGGCSKYGEPIVYILLNFNNKYFYENPKNNLLTNISCSILNYLIDIVLNKPLMLSYNLNFTNNVSLDCISVNILIPNDLDKIYLFLNEIYNFIKNIKIHLKKISKIFINNLLIKCSEELTNVNYCTPWIFSDFIIMSKYSLIDLLDTLSKIRYRNIKKYIKYIFKEKSLTSLTSIIYGNIELTDKLKHIFINFDNFYNNLEYKLSIYNNISNKFILHPNIKETSNCVTYYYYIGEYCNYDYLLLTLFINMISQDFFNYMRTEKELGYLVKMDKLYYNKKYYIIQKIQSDKDVYILENLLNIYNNTIIEKLKTYNINKYIDVLKKDYSDIFNNLSEIYDKYHKEIIIREYLFNKNSLLLNILNTINFQDLIYFVNKYFNNNNLTKIIIKKYNS
jgi:insulysin